MAANLTVLRRAFVDVCNGYSIGHTKEGQTVYVRHLGHRGHMEYDALQAGFEEEAITKGALTEAQSLERLCTQGSWSLAREADIAKQKDFISRLEDGRKTIAIPSILKSHEEHIGREKTKLATMIHDRAKLLGMTAEVYAQRRLEDHYMVSNLFADATLTTRLYDPEAFDTLADSEVDDIHETYSKAVEPCSEGNLRKLAVQDFFMSYYVLCADNPALLFDKAVCDLTYHQVRLLNQGRYWKALLDNTDLNRLPADKRGDPDAIESLHISQKNLAQMNAEGKAPVGMSPEDIKATGQRFSAVPPPNLSGVELIKWMQKNSR